MPQLRVDFQLNSQRKSTVRVFELPVVIVMHLATARGRHIMLLTVTLCAREFQIIGHALARVIAVD